MRCCRVAVRRQAEPTSAMLCTGPGCGEVGRISCESGARSCKRFQGTGRRFPFFLWRANSQGANIQRTFTGRGLLIGGTGLKSMRCRDLLVGKNRRSLKADCTSKPWPRCEWLVSCAAPCRAEARRAAHQEGREEHDGWGEVKDSRAKDQNARSVRRPDVNVIESAEGLLTTVSSTLSTSPGVRAGYFLRRSMALSSPGAPHAFGDAGADRPAARAVCHDGLAEVR